MRKETFVLTTASDTGTHSEIWDSTNPKPIGHPFKWVLENTKNGVRLRNIGGGIGNLHKDVTIHIPEDAIQRHEFISVPTTSNTEQHPLKRVKLVRTNGIHPPYIHQDSAQTDAEAIPHLLIFSGIRRALVASREVHSAYIAYSKGKPVFSFHNSKDKFTIKPLLNEVQLKKKGQAPVSGESGASWTLTQEELLDCTVIRGIYWWKFNVVTLPKTFAEQAEEKNELKPVPFYKTSPFILSALFMLLAISIQLIPTPEKEEVKEAPVVQLKFAKNKIDQNLFGNQNQASMLPEAESAPQNAQQPPSSAPKQSIAEAQSAKLKNAFKGLTALVSKNPVKAVNSTDTSKTNIFDSNNTNTSVSKTEVKPVLSGTNAKVSGIGGGGTTAGGDGAAVGYGSGKLGSANTAGGNFVNLDSAGSTVDEGLSKEEVGAVIHKHMNEVRFCHEAALIVNPKVQGKLNVNFTIGADGRVKKAEAQPSDLQESKLDKCIISRLVTWQFPKPRGGVNVGVSYPFIFKTLAKE